MKLGLVAAKIIAADTRFGDRVGGTVELDLAITSTLEKDMAFVVPLGQDVTPNMSDVTVEQKVTERFGVVVALASDTSQADKLGITAFDLVDSVRTELFKALLGWAMPEMNSLVAYAGGSILNFNRAYLWYRFDFSCDTWITQDDGVEDTSVDLLNTIYAQLQLKEY
uniref:Uncharacterized protein n=1 Tax=viral metagenome TaxID=1070528 RepID=A0A6M3IUD6_9ZZZZ